MPALVVLILIGPTSAMSQTDDETFETEIETSETEAETSLTEVELDQTEAVTGSPTRPGGAEGAILVSDGLAECAAILVVASRKSRNFVSRKNMAQSSSDWFAEAGLRALEETGEIPGIEVWEGKVSSWSERIGSVEAMARHQDWMAYCSAIGAEYSLDHSHFTVASN